MKKLLALSFSFIIIFFINCVYFNLYYNAETAFTNAQKKQEFLAKKNPDSSYIPNSEIESQYRRSIEKSKKIFELYPKSKKWHPKAWFLIGKNYYYLGEYEKASRAFIQLQKEFPQSDLIPESFLWLAKTYLKNGSLDESEKIFNIILERYPHLNKNNEINLLKAEISLQREGKSQAVSFLEENYNNAKNIQQKMELAIRIAQIYCELKQTDRAIKIIEKTPKDKKNIYLLFKIEFIRASCYEDKNDFYKALDIVEVMLKNKEYISYFAPLKLKKADILYKLKRTDEAIKIYEIVAQNASYGNLSGEAWFNLARIYQTDKDDIKKAKECYDKAQQLLTDASKKEIAAKRSKAIETLNNYRAEKNDDKKAKDSTKTSIDFKIGELFWLELDQPDSAFFHYCKTARDTSNKYLAAKSLYAASWIAKYALQDSLKADSLYNVLINNYPHNAFSKQALTIKGINTNLYTREDSARSEFEAAEKLLIIDKKADSAAMAYLDVFNRYKNTEFGPKSLYAAAWINDFILEKNRTAKILYDILCDSFPSSSYCINEAKSRLKIVEDSIAALKARIRQEKKEESLSVKKTDSLLNTDSLSLIKEKNQNLDSSFAPDGYRGRYYRHEPIPFKETIPPSSIGDTLKKN